MRKYHTDGAAMKVPFTKDHDVEDAGLLDYRERITPKSRDWPPDDGSVSKWYRLALFLALVALIGLLSFVLAGCAWHYPPRAERNHLDAIHPTPERIAELSAINNPQSPIANAAWLRLSSPFVLAGNGVRLTCFFPLTRDHRYLRLGLIDAVSPVRMFTHATNFDQLLIESVPCGEMSAICDSLATSNRVLVHLEQSFTSRGSCNAGETR